MVQATMIVKLSLCCSMMVLSVLGISTTVPSTPLCYHYISKDCEDARLNTNMSDVERENLCKPVPMTCRTPIDEHSGCVSVWKQRRNETLPAYTDNSLESTILMTCMDLAAWDQGSCGTTCIARRVVYEHTEDNNTVSVTCCCSGPLCNTPEDRILNITEQTTQASCRNGQCDSSYKPSHLFRNSLIIAAVVGVVGTIVLIVMVIYVRRKHAHGSYREVASPLQACDTEEDMSILRAQLSPQREIAQGRYAKVYYGGEINSVHVVIKCFTAAHKKMWQQERDIYRTPGMSGNDNVARFFGATQSGTGNNMSMWIVIQYYPNGSIYDYLKGHILTWPVMLKIAHSMMKGLAYLHGELGEAGGHKRSLAHRDIKSKNILVRDDMTAAIADFGLAQYFKDGVVNESHAQFQAGTHRYMAPEVLDGAITFTRDAFLRIDIYAAALVLWELLTRCDVSQNRSLEYKAPYEDMEPVGRHCSLLESLQTLVCKERKRPSFPSCLNTNPHALSLITTIEEAWDADSEARLSAGCIESRLQTLIATSVADGTELNNMRNLQPPQYEESNGHAVPLIQYTPNI